MTVTHVRPMVRTDLTAVLAIESQANPVPWKATDFQVFFERVIVGGPMAWVWANPEVQGFACAVAAADEVELQAIAVAKNRWGLGLGSALMETLIAWSRVCNCRNLHLEVREGNSRALEFYTRWGFAKVGSRQKYYRDNGEAALLLIKTLGPVSA